MAENTLRPIRVLHLLFSFGISLFFIIFTWLGWVDNIFIAKGFLITYLIVSWLVFIIWISDIKKWYDYKELEDFRCINDTFTNLILFSVLQIVTVLTYMYVQAIESQILFYVLIFAWCIFIIANLILRYEVCEKTAPVYIKQQDAIQKMNRQVLDSENECEEAKKKYEKAIGEVKEISQKYEAIKQKAEDLNLQSEKYRIKAQNLQAKLKEAHEEIALLKRLDEQANKE